MKLVLTLVLGILLLSGAAQAAVFAKYDGIDGESKDSNHDKWIDVLSIDWGMHQPAGSMTGQSRRRGSVVVEDMRITQELEKSSPKLQEKLLKGEVIPKLELELTANYGGSRATYYKYELKNVRVVSYNIHASGEDRPVEEFSLNFEEFKVSYSEYDREGILLGRAEFMWNLQEGRV